MKETEKDFMKKLHIFVMVLKKRESGELLRRWKSFSDDSKIKGKLEFYTDSRVQCHRPEDEGQVGVIRAMP